MSKSSDGRCVSAFSLGIGIALPLSANGSALPASSICNREARAFRPLQTALPLKAAGSAAPGRQPTGGRKGRPAARNKPRNSLAVTSLLACDWPEPPTAPPVSNQPKSFPSSSTAPILQRLLAAAHSRTRRRLTELSRRWLSPHKTTITTHEQHTRYHPHCWQTPTPTASSCRPLWIPSPATCFSPQDFRHRPRHLRRAAMTHQGKSLHRGQRRQHGKPPRSRLLASAQTSNCIPTSKGCLILSVSPMHLWGTTGAFANALGCHLARRPSPRIKLLP